VTAVMAVTSHVIRLYALAVALLIFFLAWATIAAHPWKASASAVRDPRVVALAARERRLRRDAVVVRRVVERRWAKYRVELRVRRREIAAAHRRQLAAQRVAQAAEAAAAQAASAPAPVASSAAPPVQVVTLPPVTITRTS
jgi:pyruvate/2-oxoglutarate dehydrogenase complex dihydrolipoamide acyltransferase (E2) component